MKSVRFNPIVEIQYMHVWTFAYHEARKSDWTKFAADRYRFELRKEKMEKMLINIGFFYPR